MNFKRSFRGLILGSIPEIVWGGGGGGGNTGKKHNKILKQNSCFPCRELNLGRPVYEVEIP